MEIQQSMIGAGTRRRPPVPGAPLAEVVLGAADDAPVGLVHVSVPPGGGMPEHDHGPSTIVLVPLTGTAQLIDVADGERVLELEHGAVTTIPVGRRVRLHNPGSDPADLLVIVSPPDFARRIAQWPALPQQDAEVTSAG